MRLLIIPPSPPLCQGMRQYVASRQAVLPNQHTLFELLLIPNHLSHLSLFHLLPCQVMRRDAASRQAVLSNQQTLYQLLMSQASRRELLQDTKLYASLLADPTATAVLEQVWLWKRGTAQHGKAQARYETAY